MSHRLDALDTQLLEPLLQDFVRLVGLASTMAIVEKWGGLPLYVASQPTSDSDLARLIGLDAAQLLGREYGGDRPHIPKAGKALRALRDARIRAEHADKSIRQLVLDYGLSERRICEILAVGQVEHPDLFD